MNSLSDVSITNSTLYNSYLNSCTADALCVVSSASDTLTTSDLTVTHEVKLGSHTFSVEALGQLLSLLMQSHPEVLV